MKANELMVGNYVMDRLDSVRIVDYMDEFKIYQRAFVCGLEVHPLTEFYNHLKPIPLTEQWLIDFEFRKYGTDIFENILYGKMNNGILISLKGSDNFWRLVDFNISRIRYVHQLQNLYFALTEEELTKTSKPSNAEK